MHRRDRPHTKIGFCTSARLFPLSRAARDDHKRVLISHADTDTGSLLTDNGFGVVAALLGALSTPEAIRHEEPAPVRLNQAAKQKGKVPFAPMIVIDMRASHVAKSQPRGSTGWTFTPHWRRSHLRTLAEAA
jgi:hypothetical protein